ncbi:hypothetical protein, partial [Klebsiella pneumoniae]|uniref:hypothetical protein n=1 Tax=Klebsiella pneumoniae TaxID=573 RepID=UPI00195471F1
YCPRQSFMGAFAPVLSFWRSTHREMLTRRKVNQQPVYTDKTLYLLINSDFRTAGEKFSGRVLSPIDSTMD